MEISSGLIHFSIHSNLFSIFKERWNNDCSHSPIHYPFPRGHPAWSYGLLVGSSQSRSSSSTSLDGTREPFLLLHQVSSMAMKQDRTIPAARMQKTPAKLFMSRAPPFCFVSTEEYRSHWPFLGHHLCFRMSMSPLC